MLASLFPLHLLIIDADAASRRASAAFLRDEGFLVTEARSGVEGLRAFEAGSFQLVMIDVLLAGVTAFDVCRVIRASALGAMLPVLLLASLEDPTSIEMGFSAGATDFIHQPVNLTLLAYRVRHALMGSQAATKTQTRNASLARTQDMAGIGHWHSGASGTVTCSGQLAVLLGTSAAMLRHTDRAGLLARVAPHDRARVRHARSNLADNGIAYHLRFEVVTDSGGACELYEHGTPVTDGQGRQVGMEGIAREVSGQSLARETIRHLSNVDAATGLPNHDYFDMLVAPLFARAHLQGHDCTFLHISLDRFTEISEAMGRAQADRILLVVAQRLTALCRLKGNSLIDTAQPHADLLARTGPASFSCCLIGVFSLEALRAMAQRILSGLAVALPTSTHDLSLAASIGIAVAPGDAVEPHNLAQCAAQAAAAAHRSGGAQYRFFNESMNALATERLQIEAELRHAIANDELRLHFQPLVNAAKRTMVGAEALVRWQHPTRGLLGPDVFIHIAEQSGQMAALTDWVLVRACRSLQEWTHAGLPGLPLSVNLPTTILLDSGLVGKLDNLLRQCQLAPTSLKLEITETLLMRDVETSVAVLDALRARGFGLSIDDFGTGYSSLGYLRDLPVHEMKIDRSFVTNAALGGSDAVLAKTMIVLGREFNLCVVAEGVETAAQSAFFTQHGCAHQQGYLFSRPVPGAAYARLLADSRPLFSAVPCPVPA